MRLPTLASIAVLAVVAACGSDSTVPTCCTSGAPSLRVVNAITSPVDVLIDGNVAIASLAPGTIGTAAAPSGSHALVLRPTQLAASASRSITTSDGTIATVAVVLTSTGGVQGAVLDDTNSVVPAGATKVRVLHLAPNAGPIQVFRTQPDFPTPVDWQFPFTYQSDPTAISAPFVQSTVGTWEIHVWQTPADSSGWANAPIKIQIPLASGEKKTVMILDKPGGGIRYEIL
ncbi:MAG TPA: DUF4397 domain-containing protein [Gemmatimonadaceae bacterium]